MTPAKITSDAEYLSRPDLERAAWGLRRARVHRNAVKDENGLRRWKDKFIDGDLAQGLPTAASDEIAHMYGALQRRVFGAGGG